MNSWLYCGKIDKNGKIGKNWEKILKIINNYKKSEQKFMNAIFFNKFYKFLLNLTNLFTDIYKFKE